MRLNSAVQQATPLIQNRSFLLNPEGTSPKTDGEKLVAVLKRSGIWIL